MSLRNRQRLLAIARLLDRRAADIRAFVKKRTPRRGPRQSAAPTEAHVALAGDKSI